MTHEDAILKKGTGMMSADFVEDKSAVAAPESNGLHTLTKNLPSVISGQLRDELIRILRTGDDKKGGAFTVAIAAQVEKFTAAAREILMTENLAQNDLASLMRMRKHQMGSPYVPYSGVVGANGFDSDSLTSLPYSSNNENFGVQAVRQIVDAARTMGESPAKLVEALAVARANNLADVAAVLEKKLGVSKAELVSEDERAFGHDASTIPTLPDGRPLQ